jgi:predicted ribosome quality control (RQC) complex YloA/Tae2 family protein
VTAVSQVGTDRIIDIQFSDGQYRLFFEFYAGGNIVLTDKDLFILAVLRVIKDGQEEVRVGVKYSLENRQNIHGVPPITKERVLKCLGEAPRKPQDTPQPGSKKSGQKNEKVLRKVLTSAFPEFPPMLMEHALQSVDIEMTAKPKEFIQQEALLEKLMSAFKLAQDIIGGITSSELCQGYIIAKPRKGLSDDKSESTDASAKPSLVYDDFQPFKPKQFENDQSNILPFQGYNKTVDEFFSSVEAQKLEGRLADREEHAKKKLEAARKDHEKRIGGLQEVQELNIRKAQAIEANVERVEEATAAINGLIAQGMDWVEIARLIEMEQGRGNAVAQLVRLPLKLYENTATLLLSELESNEDDFEGDLTDDELSESDEDSERQHQSSKSDSKSELAVDINLAFSPWANARQYYDQRRNAVAKEQKTQQSSSKALKSTEKKITADLKKGMKTEKAVLRPVRQQFWFEKFWFFLSSDGYLVLGYLISQFPLLYCRRLTFA